MTVAAVAPEAAPMGVIRIVTIETVVRHSSTVRHGRSMACGALEPFMGAVEGEIRLTIVIESPASPAVRIVTILAASAQRPFVHVVDRMTGAARDLLLLEAVVPMAGLAGGHRVQPEQRESSQLVIEGDSARKRILSVAIGTILPEVAAMHVICPMASITVDRELLLGDSPRMAGVAGGLRMGRSQGELGLLGVIESHLVPGRRRVTGSTLRTEASRMHVLVRMTA